MLTTVELGARQRVPKHAVDLEVIGKELLVKNKMAGAQMAFSGASIDYIQLWEEDEDHIILPRSYTPPWLVTDVDYDVKEFNWPIIEFPPFIKELDPARDQINAWEALTSIPGDKTLCLGCGRGKTELALKYAAWYGTSTLIIVDREHIADQWLERICGSPTKEPSFANVHREDVGWVQQNVVRIGKHFTIAIVHTLSRRLYKLPRWFWDHFGLVILDELHIFGAEMFNEVIPMLSGERLGLTATWERRDGLEASYLLHCGGMQPCYVNVTPLTSKKWVFKELPRLIEPFQERYCYKITGGKRTVEQADGSYVQEQEAMFVMHKYFKLAGANQWWFDLICDDITSLYLEGRTILVLGVQNWHLECIESFCINAGYDVGRVDHTTEASNRKVAFRRRIVIATEKMVEKALDIQALDTLLLLVPHNDEGRTRQESERIGRDVAGQFEPLVIVYCHANKTLQQRTIAMKANVKRLDVDARIFEEKVHS